MKWSCLWMNRNFSCARMAWRYRSMLSVHPLICGAKIPLSSTKDFLLFYIRWFFCSRFSSPLKPENFSLNRQSEKSRLLYSNRLLSTIWEPHKIDILEIMARGWTSIPRKKLVASRSVVSAFTSEQRRRSVTFCEKGGTVKRVTDFLKKSERAQLVPTWCG